MNIYAEGGTRVKYTGCSDAQAQWGGCDDPRGLLHEGNVYTINYTDVHSLHTRVCLKEIKDKEFNSVCFEDLDD